MNKQWFVLHTLVGQEQKALKSILARIQLNRMEEYIGRCIIPTERVSEKKNGKRRTMTRRVFPGYILAEVALYDESKGVDAAGNKVRYDRTWQFFVHDTPGIIGFLGGNYPQPLKQAEVDAILLDKPASGSQAGRPKVDFNVNETVKITDGAFMGLTGQVSMVDPDKGKLRVDVEVFNRKVPVDVEYWQVEKVSDKELQASAESRRQVFRSETDRKVENQAGSLAGA